MRLTPALVRNEPLPSTSSNSVNEFEFAQVNHMLQAHLFSFLLVLTPNQNPEISQVQARCQLVEELFPKAKTEGVDV